MCSLLRFLVLIWIFVQIIESSRAHAKQENWAHSSALSWISMLPNEHVFAIAMPCKKALVPSQTTQGWSHFVSLSVNNLSFDVWFLCYARYEALSVQRLLFCVHITLTHLKHFLNVRLSLVPSFWRLCFTPLLVSVRFNAVGEGAIGI